ncbi:hypothetical protein K402DRAFT_401894 [Aulographum hederae CBS 113979]|uniref:Uncharacterized protein n=1 Tax=Aulographum hederae CBS 113979 TaxID=1176131 RepID=A0A6G1H9A7_9PEZI|nr:hypothetical protein K402DRAFT_401894 [Aulographum hederae CBS 113979]
MPTPPMSPTLSTNDEDIERLALSDSPSPSSQEELHRRPIVERDQDPATEALRKPSDPSTLPDLSSLTSFPFASIPSSYANPSTGSAQTSKPLSSTGPTSSFNTGEPSSFNKQTEDYPAVSSANATDGSGSESDRYHYSTDELAGAGTAFSDPVRILPRRRRRREENVIIKDSRGIESAQRPRNLYGTRKAGDEDHPEAPQGYYREVTPHGIPADAQPLSTLRKCLLVSLFLAVSAVGCIAGLSINSHIVTHVPIKRMILFLCLSAIIFLSAAAMVVARCDSSYILQVATLEMVVGLIVLTELQTVRTSLT